MPERVEVDDALLVDIDPRTLYDILALRAAVFVVEQSCVYQDLDGRDAEPNARQLWIKRAGQLVATLRMLRDADGRARIGRVATRADARSEGLAAGADAARARAERRR